MKLFVAGASGQVATALRGLRADDLKIVALGRPAFDLDHPATFDAALDTYAPDVVACVGAYTAVDQAETEPDAAMRTNAEGPGALAMVCAARGLPIIFLSTDYVFDGEKSGAYVETDLVNPQGAYGRSKLDGERRVAAAQPRHAILRTSWVYHETGRNFVRTMLRLARARDRVGVVADQWGAPTYATHIAEGVVAVARNLVAAPSAEMYGVFHMAGAGRCTWADFAAAIFARAAALDGPHAGVDRITTADFPTPTRRPANSQLDCAKLARAHGVALAPWQTGLDACITALAADGWAVD